MLTTEIGELEKRSIPHGNCDECGEVLYCHAEIVKYRIDKKKLIQEIDNCSYLGMINAAFLKRRLGLESKEPKKDEVRDKPV